MLFFDIGLRQDVLLALIVGQRQGRLALSDFHPVQQLAAFERYRDRAEARRDRPARLKDRFHQVDAREPAADARQLRTNALPLVAELMALQT